jgi:hypothetical protein
MFIAFHSDECFLNAVYCFVFLLFTVILKCSLILIRNKKVQIGEPAGLPVFTGSYPIFAGRFSALTGRDAGLLPGPTGRFDFDNLDYNMRNSKKLELFRQDVVVDDHT